MPYYKVSPLATLLGVRDDTVRRWLDDGLVTRADSAENSGPLRIDGASVAALINSLLLGRALSLFVTTSRDWLLLFTPIR